MEIMDRIYVNKSQRIITNIYINMYKKMFNLTSYKKKAN